MVFIAGRIEDTVGHPVSGARIQVLKNTGEPVASGYTSGAGTFHLEDITPGMYELVVTRGLVETRERVALDESPAGVMLRLPVESAPDTGNGYTVSVQEMRVSGKARKAFHEAQVAFDRSKFDDAGRRVAEALLIAPDYAQALTLRGLLQLDAGQIANAQHSFEDAIRSDRGYALAYLALGATFNAMSRFETAIPILEQGLALAPQSWQGHFELGKARIGLGDCANGLRELDRATDLSRDNYALIHLVRARALLGLRRNAEAADELETYLRKEPEGPGANAARQTLESLRAATH
jgi:tetratricopeptide (TPR) repeat protein